ncbi:MAG: hypothetical protein ACLP3K_06530 [Candidatus Acidiferrales bacterium]
MGTHSFPVKITIQGVFQLAPVGGAPIPISATLQNEVPTSGGVTWSITAAGSSCSPACGTIAGGPFPGLTATYTPPADDPSGASLDPTITATSVTEPSKSSSFSFKLETKAVFSYMVLLRGFDSFGSPMAMAGNVIADENENIRGGELDINDGHEIAFISGPLAGSYAINSAPNAVVRGTINLTNVALPGGAANLTFKFVISADHTNGEIIEVDGAGYFNEGTIQVQNPTALGLGVPAGPFAFGLDSDDPLGSRVVEAGQFGLSAGGVVTSGIVDQSQAGGASPTYAAKPISGSATTPDSLGRGRLTLTANGSSNLYAYYIVDSSQINLIEIENGSSTVQSGVGRTQGSMNAASVNMTSVLQLTGMNHAPGTNAIAPAAVIGLATITGDSSLDVLFDSNNVGTVVTKVSVSGSVASFDPATGRGVLSVTGGFTSGFVNSAVFYLYDSGDGFLIDTDTTAPGGATNYALSGTLTARAGSPFSNATLSGNAILGVGGSPTRDVPNAVAGIDFTSSAGTFSGTGSLTSFFKSGGPFVDSSFINATYQVVDTTNGYGTAMVPASLFDNFTSNLMYPASFYIIDANRAVMIGTQAGSYSGVVSLTPF